MNANFRRSLSVVTAIVVLGAASSWAEDYRFMGESGGEFLDPANWAPTGTPAINDVAVLDESVSAVLSGPVEISRLALGNDAALTIAAEGVLSVGKNHLYVGISGFNGIQGVGTASLKLEEGGQLSVGKFYLAAYDPPGRSGSVAFEGGKISVADRFWVGANALNDGVTGELTIRGSKLTWETPTNSLNLGGGRGNAILNFVFDEEGISAIHAATVQLGNENAVVNFDLSDLNVTDDMTVQLITYSGELTGEFGDILIEGLPDGFDGAIEYGSGEDDAVSLSVKKR
ncbi:MAG: hypothetical protein WA771_12095 [Chthoniobacterales bacterium]